MSKTKQQGGLIMMSMSTSSSSSSSSSNTSRKKKASNKTKKTSLQRIDKVLADRGLGTRSQTFELAKAKRITMASHPDAPHEERIRIAGPKVKVPSGCALFLDGNLLPAAAPLLLIYHKPKFVLSVMEDDKKYKDQERKHLGQVLDARYKRCGMHPVGRLDYDTTGLILFSLDGKLTQRLLHPRRGVEKEYVATVQGVVDEEKLRELLKNGVETSDGTFGAQLMGVTPSDGPISNPDGEDNILWDEESSIEDRAVLDYTGEHSDVRLIVTEGKVSVLMFPHSYRH
jgi:pseudouridine synthase